MQDDPAHEFPRTFSKSQVDKLGEELAVGAPAEELLERLQVVRAEYDGPMARVESVLRDDLRLEPTSRLKTTNTIIDKLRRERTRLSTMQDIAGVRVVEDLTLTKQDELVERIRERFPRARMLDRRARPTYGYRAVHVIPTVGDFPVEIQVRTHLQDRWAQAFEKLADVWGRGIRYGDEPLEADRVVVVWEEQEVTRGAMVAAIRELSRSCKQVESARDRAARVHARLKVVEPPREGADRADHEDLMLELHEVDRQVEEADLELSAMLSMIEKAFSR